MSAAPWLKKIEYAIEEAKLIPLWGHIPVFPWSEFSRRLSQDLEFEQIEIEPHRSEWRPNADLLSGMGDHPFITPIELGPFAQPAFWVMSQEDVMKLTRDALSPHKRLKAIFDPDFQKGFYTYLCLDALQVLDQLSAFDELTLRMKMNAPMPDEESFCIDTFIKTELHSLWGRVICPKSLFHDFRQHFLEKKASLFNPHLTKEIEATIHLEIGHVNLVLDRWKQVHVGDFIFLDKCTFDPATDKGTVALILETTPLFRAKIKQGQIKIIDEVFYYEEDNPMSKTPPNDEHEDEDEEEYEEEDEYEENDDEEEGLEEDENEELPEEDLQEPAEKLSDAELDEESRNNEHLWDAQEDSSVSAEPMIATAQIPLHLTVEVARLRMSLDKIMQLKPGNLLELSIQPELGVDLCVGGKKIARGELIRLGEMLGVKILQIGEEA